LVLKKLLTL